MPMKWMVDVNGGQEMKKSACLIDYVVRYRNHQKRNKLFEREIQ